MKHKVGDRVRIKSIDWHNENKDIHGNIDCGDALMNIKKSQFCGKIVTISSISDVTDTYKIEEDNGQYNWTDDMIEQSEEHVYEITEDFLKNVVDDIRKNTSMKSTELMQILGVLLHPTIDCPEGYVFKDENGNVINATKIVLEKKHDDKLKLESTKKVREYWSEYAKIFIEIYDDEPNECVFTHLWVVDGQRQKGHGKRALIEAETIAKELGCHTAYLKVETDSWMNHWYLRCGYQWYKNADKDYVWLTKNL